MARRAARVDRAVQRPLRRRPSAGDATESKLDGLRGDAGLVLDLLLGVGSRQDVCPSRSTTKARTATSRCRTTKTTQTTITNALRQPLPDFFGVPGAARGRRPVGWGAATMAAEPTWRAMPRPGVAPRPQPMPGRRRAEPVAAPRPVAPPWAPGRARWAAAGPKPAWAPAFSGGYHLPSDGQPPTWALRRVAHQNLPLRAEAGAYRPRYGRARVHRRRGGGGRLAPPTGRGRRCRWRGGAAWTWPGPRSGGCARG